MNVNINTNYSGKSENYQHKKINFSSKPKEQNLDCIFHINNASSFPHQSINFSCTKNNINSDCKESSKENKTKKKATFYTINLDWLQMVCNNPDGKTILDEFINVDLIIDKVNIHNNPNFYSKHIIYYKNKEVLDVYSNPVNNDSYKNDEVLVKVSNYMLYQNEWTYTIDEVLNILNFKIKRFNKIAIALDGEHNLKILDLCRRYLRTHTIVLCNGNLNIQPKHFKKNELAWSEYIIGSKTSNKIARVYDKTKEIKSSNKTYINQYYEINNLSATHVGRFEIELGWKFLKKYEIESIHQFLDVTFIGSIFKKEVEDWLQFYKVKLKDIKTLRKDKAIKKGVKKNFIRWNLIPADNVLLQDVSDKLNNVENAKRSITHALKSIRRDYSNYSTKYYINYVIHETYRYSLNTFTNKKINSLFENTSINTDQLFSGLTETNYLLNKVNNFCFSGCT